MGLDQGQILIVDKVISDVKTAPQGAMVWVQGCAGTGKTLVLAKIAQRLTAMGAGRSIAFLTYTHALKEMISEIVSSESKIHVSTYDAYLYENKNRRHDIILIDEIQDIPKQHILELKSRCSHLIVAGDFEQRIYENGSSESELDENFVFSKYRLVKLYRVTKSIVELARKVLPLTMLVRGEVPDSQIDVDIAVRSFDLPQQEARWVYDEAIEFARPGYPSVILLPTHSDIYHFCRLIASDLEISNSGPKVKISECRGESRIANYDNLNAHFSHHGISMGYLGNNIGHLSDSKTRPFVYLMTYHSAKGLDFQTVFLPRLGANAKIGTSYKGLSRKLFFVAVTRARERLVVTYTGRDPYPLVHLIPTFENRVVHKNSDANDSDEGFF